MQGRWDSCDMPPLTPTRCASEVPVGGVSDHCSWNTGPHHCPQVPNCSCYSWLICPRRKQHAALKPCGKENKKTWTAHSHSSCPTGPECYTRLYNLTVILGRKTKLKKCLRSFNVVIVFLAFFIQQMFPEDLICAQCWEVWA